MFLGWMCIFFLDLFRLTDFIKLFHYIGQQSYIQQCRVFYQQTRKLYFIKLVMKFVIEIAMISNAHCQNKLPQKHLCRSMFFHSVEKISNSFDVIF